MNSKQSFRLYLSQAGIIIKPGRLFRSAKGGNMARITVEDCQERVDNRFLLVQMAIKRVKQYRDGYEPLLETRNKEVVTALREIAAGKIMPDDKSLYTPIQEEHESGEENQ